MTIQRRLALSFLAIMVLFATNQIVSIIASNNRSEAAASLRRALGRRIQIISIEQEIGNLKRQVELMNQIAPGASREGFGPREIKQFSSEIDGVTEDIRKLRELSDDETMSEALTLEKAFGELGESWMVFYRKAGRDQAAAITELVTRADPLSEKLLKRLPALNQQERTRENEASARFAEVSRLANQATLSLFCFSALLATLIAYLLARHITRGLNVLERGAASLGAENLHQQIPVLSKDELGHLAASFNQMADNLLGARNRLKQTNEELEAARLQSEAANTAKSTFLANMSHELRTPLNAIIGFSEVLADKTFGELNKRQERYVNNILTSGRHLLQLINDILDLAKVESGRMELDPSEMDVGESFRVVETVVKPLALQKKQTLRTVVPDAMPRVTADPAKFKQIMYNLVSNAIKYTPDSGTITVSAEIVAQDSGLPGGGPALRVSVIDDGIGIKAEDVDRVFGEFEQLDDSYARQQQGTGLGLALTRRFVELHQGRIWVESEGPGKGSSFHFVLPLAPEADKSVADPAPTHNSDHAMGQTVPVATDASRRTVLVIEDDPKARELMSYYLTEGGYTVLTASSAEEATRIAREMNPYAITLDIVLQNEDGWQVLEKLKSQPETKAIPVVIVSITEDRQLGAAFGATEFLVKPVDRNRLVEAVEHAGAGRRASSILVVDDQPETVDLLTDVLKSRGFGVIPAYGGQQGIDLAIERLPDVIVLDLMMPEVSGFDVVQRLREHAQARDIPILIFTAKEITPEDRERLRTQVQAVISKSGKDDLLRELQKPRALIGAKEA
ncbi:MAG: response regulator [Armatimonadota bacterium]